MFVREQFSLDPEKVPREFLSAAKLVIDPQGKTFLVLTSLQPFTPEHLEYLSNSNYEFFGLECGNPSQITTDKAATLFNNDKLFVVLVVDPNGGLPLPPSVLDGMAQHTGELRFPLVKALSADAAKALEPHAGTLVFQNLERLDDEALKCLVRHRGRLSFPLTKQMRQSFSAESFEMLKSRPEFAKAVQDIEMQIEKGKMLAEEAATAKQTALNADVRFMVSVPEYQGRRGEYPEVRLFCGNHTKAKIKGYIEVGVSFHERKQPWLLEVDPFDSESNTAKFISTEGYLIPMVNAGTVKIKVRSLTVDGADVTEQAGKVVFICDDDAYDRVFVPPWASKVRGGFVTGAVGDQ
jgi:hypothetical protein